MLTRRPIETAPTSSQSHAYYAYCCFVTQMAHWSEDRDRFRVEAIEFAKRAVTLDDADNSARWILGKGAKTEIMPGTLQGASRKSHCGDKCGDRREDEIAKPN